MEKICLKIYEENKVLLYKYIRKKCTWLSEDDIQNIMLIVWEELCVNVRAVYRLKNKESQSMWLLSVTHRLAREYKKGV